MSEKPISVLIIDDSEDNIAFLLPFLRAYKVHYAHNGKDGIQLAKDKKPDIILLDVRMPYMDGFEVLQELQANNETKDIVTIMLTGKDDVASIVSAMKQGATDYIVRSDNVKEVQDKLALYTQQIILPRRNNKNQTSGITPAKNRKRVFISYSNNDAEFATLLKEKIESDKFEGWIDHSKIKASEFWVNSITEALKTCSAMVLVMSEDAMKSRYVTAEYLAIIRMDKPLIPVLYKPCEVPFILEAIHYINYLENPDVSIDKVIQTLHDVLG